MSKKTGDCFLTFSEPISKRTIHSLVVDVIEYILFYRGQIPSLLNQKKRSSSVNGSTIDSQKVPEKSHHSKTFGDVLVYVDASHPSVNQVKRPDRATQLYKESLSKFDTFFQDISSLLQSNVVLEAILKLGPSFPTAEIYHIKLPKKCEVAECNTDSIPMHKCRSQLYKMLFSSNFTSTLIERPVSISVMLHLLPGTKLSSNMEYKKCYTIPKNAKCKLVSFDCYCSHTLKSVTQDVADDCSSISPTNGTSNSTSLWVLVKPELKGIPQKKNVVI